MPKPKPRATDSVAFSVRHLRATSRDRLHALAAMIEARSGTRVTMEALVNSVVAAGLEVIEGKWYPPQSAQRLKESLDSGPAKLVG